MPAGESVEENANVVVRLLIRRPECFGPALRGEGGSGLLAAIEDAIKISEDPARDGPTVKKDRRRELCVAGGGTGTSTGTGMGTGMEMEMGTLSVGAPRGCWGRTNVPVLGAPMPWGVLGGCWGGAGGAGCSPTHCRCSCS